MSSEGRAPWERLEGETVRAFAGFTAYADLPPKQRSVVAAYRSQTGRGSVRSAPGYWYGWGRANRWEERAAARDRHLAIEALEALAEERRTFARAAMAASRLGLAKVMERLQALDPQTMSITEAIRLLEVAVKLHREAFADLLSVLSLQRPADAEVLLERLRDQLFERALAGDMKAADVLVRLDERLARARGTDAPNRHVVGIEQMIERISGGVALAKLSPDTRKRVVAELTSSVPARDDGAAA